MTVQSITEVNKQTIEPYKTIWKALDLTTYEKWYADSLENPDLFWSEQAKRFITWFKTWNKVSEIDLSVAKINWFQGAKLNVSYNCLDRHLPERQNQIAYYWEGDGAQRQQAVTYGDLYEQVCRFANTLKKLGVQKGDTVCLYMPMIVNAVVAMLACTRIGAIHSVVFAGFSAHALGQRIVDANCKYIVTADDALRGSKVSPLKECVDDALALYSHKAKVLVVKNSGRKIKMHHKRDYWYHDYSLHESSICEPEWMDAEDPLFILYTSGSTGKPKGVMHTQGGYLLYAAMTHRYAFDYQLNDVYWCTADIGWITGHSYAVYGPLANGATSVMYEGVLTGPDPSLVWQLVDRYQVNIFYTAPTAIRALMAQGEQPLSKSSRDSLRILGTVGEPINPEAWRWYHASVGNSKCWIVDTWWQTETGGVLMVPFPYISHQKPGAACLPFFGVKANLLSSHGKNCAVNEKGALVIEASWPGQMRTIYQDHARFHKTYFEQFPGKYFTGDGAYRDADGDYWITGRMDDVINVSGHRLGTAEIESALVQHPKVSEAAVIGVPHEIKGEGLYAFVTLNDKEQWSPAFEKTLMDLVAQTIGKFARPEVIQWAPRLPKTRSGKIMRRVLRKIANNEVDQLGDLSTLAEPDVIEDLIRYKPKK